MSRGITLLIGRLPTISGELAGLAASAQRVISMMATRVCLLPPPLCPADGARVHVITQISPIYANIAECALSTYYTLWLHCQSGSGDVAIVT